MKVFLSWICLIVFLDCLNAVGSVLPGACRRCQRTGLCKPPSCVCCSDEMEFPRKKTPQMVYFTFDDAVAGQIIPYYKSLFTPSRFNPNGCPIAMTLFVSDNDTIYSQVKDFYDRGMEIGVHSITHNHLTPETFAKEALGQKEKIMAAGIPSKDILGWRSPYLEVEGNVQFRNLSNLGFMYDATLSTAQTDRYGSTFPIPFTLDYGWPFRCRINHCPTEPHRGFWEVPVVELRMTGDRPCVYVDACPIPWGNNSAALNLLRHNFNRYYEGNRAPLGFNMHAGWFYDPTRLKAMDQFIDELSKMDDVYILTVSKVIQWLKNPTPLDRIKYFEPWSCPQSRRKYRQPIKIDTTVKKAVPTRKGSPVPWFQQDIVQKQQQVSAKHEDPLPLENTSIWGGSHVFVNKPRPVSPTKVTEQSKEPNPPYVTVDQVKKDTPPPSGFGRMMWAQGANKQSKPSNPLDQSARPLKRVEKDIRSASVLWSIGNTEPFNTPPAQNDRNTGVSRFLFDTGFNDPFTPQKQTAFSPSRNEPVFLSPEQLQKLQQPRNEEPPIIIPESRVPSFDPASQRINPGTRPPQQVEQNKKGVSLGSPTEADTTRDKLQKIAEQLEALHAKVDAKTKSEPTRKSRKRKRPKTPAAIDNFGEPVVWPSLGADPASGLGQIPAIQPTQPPNRRAPNVDHIPFKVMTGDASRRRPSLDEMHDQGHHSLPLPRSDVREPFSPFERRTNLAPEFRPDPRLFTNAERREPVRDSFSPFERKPAPRPDPRTDPGFFTASDTKDTVSDSFTPFERTPTAGQSLRPDPPRVSSSLFDNARSSFVPPSQQKMSPFDKLNLQSETNFLPQDKPSGPQTPDISQITFAFKNAPHSHGPAQAPAPAPAPQLAPKPSPQPAPQPAPQLAPQPAQPAPQPAPQSAPQQTSAISRDLAAEARQHEEMKKWLSQKRIDPTTTLGPPVDSSKQRFLDMLSKMKGDQSQPLAGPPLTAISGLNNFGPKLHFHTPVPLTEPSTMTTTTTTTTTTTPTDPLSKRFMKIGGLSSFAFGEGGNQSPLAFGTPKEKAQSPVGESEFASKLSAFFAAQEQSRLHAVLPGSNPGTTVKTTTAVVTKVPAINNPTTVPTFPPFTYDSAFTPRTEPTTSAPVSRLGRCIQTINCFHPNCLCKSTHHYPASLPLSEVPQIVYIVMDGVVNYMVGEKMKTIFQRPRLNPNNCPISGTVFLSHKYSNYSVVKHLDRLGVEIALAGMEPNNNNYVTLLEYDIDDQLEHLKQNGISADKVSGWSSPQLHPQGDEQFRKLNLRGFYDSTLLVESSEEKRFWPFTLNFGWDERCMIETCPKESHAGMWEVPIIPLKLDKDNKTCKYADSCTYDQMNYTTTLNYLMDNFNRYYLNNKAPFGIRLNQMWFHNHYAESLEGLIGFLDAIRRKDDVYITSIAKMLKWMEEPTPVSELPFFAPWQC